jgi:RNA polymerase sigma factor (sigma-70 family)
MAGAALMRRQVLRDRQPRPIDNLSQLLLNKVLFIHSPWAFLGLSEVIFHRHLGYALLRYRKRNAKDDNGPPKLTCPSQRRPPPFRRCKISTIFTVAVRLQEGMDEPSSITLMTEQEPQISKVIAEERSRLRNFIRKRVANEADVEDLLQEVFYELVEANRLLMPIEHVTGWLFRVARNRITDLFRKKSPETFSDAVVEDEDGELLQIEDLLPSPDAGPEALYVRNWFLDELEFALGELPDEQREVFVAHELEGRSFKELSAESGVKVNTLLSRKRYAVLHLRERLQSIHDEFTKK